MTAGTFRLGSTRVVEGQTLGVAIEAFAGFGRKVYWRLSGKIDESDLTKKTLAGSVRLDRKLEGNIRISFTDDSQKEGAEKVTIELSADKSFKDQSRVLIPRTERSGTFKVVDAAKAKGDIVTGIQDPSGIFGPKGTDRTLGLLPESGSSRYGEYYAEFKSDLSSIKLFGDSNSNGEFDNKDKLLGSFRIAEIIDFGQFREGVSRTFEYKQSSGMLSLKYGGKTFLAASGDSNIF